ncbi:DUF3951 domain-containing protein [Paludifilum halophilum]|uniref:DUF3951 domain-containing protein n=1 Tax=Paludifilum halophilum TaxID=1642702 RepID=A0A235B3E8_9BACL|nr:DUF3951 domain-containing protein [Paludifilum halophilum]OYD06820.1 hypothetical protein CHM34_14815 [Paludifilum halophilum]
MERGFTTVSFSALIIVLIGIVLYKSIIRRKNVHAFYTPFDYLTGQTGVLFHDEKEEKEDDDPGDDQDKSKRSNGDHWSGREAGGNDKDG